MNRFQIEQQTLNQWLRQARIYFPALCQPRPQQSHKGDFGTLGIIGGHQGMAGSIILAGSAALKCGCGKVWLGFNQSNLPMPVISSQPEIMLATATQLLQRNDITAWVIGCGLSTEITAKQLLITNLQHHKNYLLLDADALNILAENPSILNGFNSKNRIILTPHPGEAAHLLNCSINEIENNRQQSVQRLAVQFNAWVVLKGHHSLICSPTGKIQQNQSGNAGLATAGSGDVLSGIIGSLLAQRIPVEQAVSGGVWLHGIAAEILAYNQIGPIGLCAGEIVAAARWIRNHLTA